MAGKKDQAGLPASGSASARFALIVDQIDGKEPPAFSVGHDDKIEGIYRPRDQRRDWSADGRLELMEPAPTQAATLNIEVQVRQPAPRRFPLSAFLILAALLPVAGAGFFIWSRLRPAVPPPVPLLAETVQSEALGSVHIDSEPSGASVFIDGQEAGTTPLLTNNTFPAGKSVRVRVTLPGYRPWVGVLKGGANVKLRAQLILR
jgi:hypothetical protein